MPGIALYFGRSLLIASAISAAVFSPAPAAAAPPGFADIRWGASAADIKRTFAQRTGVELTEETANRIVYRGGEFADYPADHWEMELGPKGFFRGTVYLTIPDGNAPDGAPLRNRQFDNLAAALTEKYGEPSHQPGAPNAAEATWRFADPATGHPNVFAVFLRYSWAPKEFLIRYSNEPDGPIPANWRDLLTQPVNDDWQQIFGMALDQRKDRPAETLAEKFQALQALIAKSNQRGLTIPVFLPPSLAASRRAVIPATPPDQARTGVSLVDVPAIELFRYLGSLLNCDAVETEHGIILRPHQK